MVREVRWLLLQIANLLDPGVLLHDIKGKGVSTCQFPQNLFLVSSKECCDLAVIVCGLYHLRFRVESRPSARQLQLSIDLRQFLPRSFCG